ncbi:uncharacterized protein LOC135146264 isoform X2 [Zophobas morio]|uniref:uncharacterized protein LOC135146264 isoform X2 n=1 Tax=Zophobas morio TaxID=2755281 RepID=UPI0030827604
MYNGLKVEFSKTVKEGECFIKFLNATIEDALSRRYILLKLKGCLSSLHGLYFKQLTSLENENPREILNNQITGKNKTAREKDETSVKSFSFKDLNLQKQVIDNTTRSSSNNSYKSEELVVVLNIIDWFCLRKSCSCVVNNYEGAASSTVVEIADLSAFYRFSVAKEVILSPILSNETNLLLMQSPVTSQYRYNPGTLPPPGHVVAQLMFKIVRKGSLISLRLLDGSLLLLAITEIFFSGPSRLKSTKDDFFAVSSECSVVVTRETPETLVSLRHYSTLFLPDLKLFGALLASNIATGILISGSSKIADKSTLIRNFCCTSGKNFLEIDFSTLISTEEFFCASEKYKLSFALKGFYKRASIRRPCVILFDDLESLFPRNVDDEDLLQLRYTFVTLFSNPHEEISIIGITSNESHVHPSVLPAFIDKVSIKEISQCQRIALLEEKLTSFRLEGVDKEDLAEVCQGLEAVDLFLFFRSLIDCDGSTPVTLDDYRALSKKIRLRRSGKDKMVDHVSFDSICGLSHVKESLRRTVLSFFKHRDLFGQTKFTLNNGLLLYGPPGTGKTMIAKALAYEASAQFLSFNIPELIYSEIGESEKRISTIYARARSMAPCVLFFDEMQAVFGHRDVSTTFERTVLSQLLYELDSSSPLSGVFLLGAPATNAPWSVDPSLLRPGRLDEAIFVSPPDLDTREELIRRLLAGRPVSSLVDTKLVAAKTPLFTGADLKHLLQVAIVHSMKRILQNSPDREEICKEDLEAAMESCRPSITERMMEEYSKWKLLS